MGRSRHRKDAARAARRTREAAGEAPGGAGAPAGVPPLWIVAALAVAVLVAYAPALEGRLLWDDDAHVTSPDLRSGRGLWRIWFDLRASQQYYPVLHTAFWVEHRLWGDAVLGYHVVNLAFHTTSAGLLLLLLRRLEVAGAALAAAVFALHPVHVESVAWISEQKNTLSTLLALSATYVYLRFDEERRRSSYVLATSLFVLGLLTKTVVATVPAALLVTCWWRRGRLSWRQDVLPLLPWLAAGATAGLTTAWIERRLIGAEGSDFAFTFLERCLIAGRAAWFYLGTLLWPADLSFIYPRWHLGPTARWAYLFPAAAVAVLAASWAVRRRWRAPLAVALLFLGMLFPVLGFLNVFPFVYSFVADHFVYLPSIPVIAAVAATGTRLVRAAPVDVRAWAPAAAVVLLAVLAGLTWRQSHLYRDPQSLYAATLARNPGCYMCLNNLGMISFAEGRLEEAMRRYREALRIKPDHAEAHNNLGNALVKAGRAVEAIGHYEQSVKTSPNYVLAYNNLAGALLSLGRIDEARAHYETALRLRPDYEVARRNLAIIDGMRARAPGN